MHASSQYDMLCSPISSYGCMLIPIIIMDVRSIAHCMICHQCHVQTLIDEERLYSVEWNGGMEWWNGTVEWNSGMTTPTDRVLSRPIPTIFQDTAVFSSHGQQVVSAVLLTEDELNLIQQRD